MKVVDVKMPTANIINYIILLISKRSPLGREKPTSVISKF
jgi:hypothetical protein